MPGLSATRGEAAPHVCSVSDHYSSHQKSWETPGHSLVGSTGLRAARFYLTISAADD